MAKAQGTIRYQQDGSTLLFEVEGQATMHQGLPFRRFVEKQLAAGVANVWVDLRSCTYIDSTFLGTLLFLQRAVDRKGCGAFRLLAPSSQCRDLFRQMGVDQVFHIQPALESTNPNWTQLSREPDDVKSFQRNVMQAHEELASLPGAAGEPFKEVVRCLAKDVESNPSK
jgi:anti-sigma B factor antagonist